MEENTQWYYKKNTMRITNIYADTDIVTLPEKYNGYDVTELHLEGEDARKNQARIMIAHVRQLYIPKSITRIGLYNYNFPDLEEVIVDKDNEEYSTDGKLLFEKKGKRLLNCLVDGEDSLVIPQTVLELKDECLAYLHYKYIRFESKSISLDDYAGDVFKESVWAEKQKGMIVIGNVLYQIPEKTERLVVPDTVRKFYAGAFKKSTLREVVLPVLPGASDLKTLNNHSSELRMEITSKTCKINVHWLRLLDNLSALILPDDHKYYRTIDGVLYSKDGKYLLHYPQNKKDVRYEVPEGTERIGALAFAQQRYLNTVTIADSVKKIDVGAFLKCYWLQSVKLPKHLTELPDSNIYTKGGVFEDCDRMEQIEFPDGLKYIGNYCFYKSGLRKVTFNSHLEMIGEYSFCCEKLKEVRLPASLKRVGKGALLYAEEIHAYEGTAKGLIASVNAIYPGEKESIANIMWSKCIVHVHNRYNESTFPFIIPESIKITEAYHLDLAWNHDKTVDMDEYDACFGAIKDSGERMQIAQNGILRTKGNQESVYYDYLKNVSGKIAINLLEERREKEFLAFLKQDFLSEQSLEKALKLSNKLGLTTCSAYIMEYQKKSGKVKNKSFRL